MSITALPSRPAGANWGPMLARHRGILIHIRGFETQARLVLPRPWRRAIEVKFGVIRKVNVSAHFQVSIWTRHVDFPPVCSARR